MASGYVSGTQKNWHSHERARAARRKRERLADRVHKAPPARGSRLLVRVDRMCVASRTGSVTVKAEALGVRGSAIHARHTTANLVLHLRLVDEGRTWVREWEGEVPDVLRACVALQQLRVS